MVSLYSRTPVRFPSAAALSAGVFWSSKNLRQSSSASAVASSSGLSSSSSSSSLPADFGLGGRAPSSSTHHIFSSDASVGNVTMRSKSDRRFSGTCGCCFCEYVASRPLWADQSTRFRKSEVTTYADSLRKNHLISSHSLSHFSTKRSLTSESSLPSSVLDPSWSPLRRLDCPSARGEGGHNRSPCTICLKCERWNWGRATLLLPGALLRDVERCFCRDSKILREDVCGIIYEK